MTHFAKVAVALEHLVADVACQLGETDPKKLMKWRHLYRDAVRPLYREHMQEATPYMSQLLEIAIEHSRRIQTVYASMKPLTPMEAYKKTIRAEGSPVLNEGTGFGLPP